MTGNRPSEYEWCQIALHLLPEGGCLAFGRLDALNHGSCIWEYAGKINREAFITSKGDTVARNFAAQFMTDLMDAGYEYIDVSSIESAKRHNDWVRGHSSARDK